MPIGSQWFAGIESPKTLKDIITDAGIPAALDIYDAGDANCYSGSGQTFASVGSGTNDMYLGTGSGADSADPTFAGSAGDLTSAKFTFDGGDFGTLVAGGVPSTYEAMHKEGGIFAVYCLMKQAATDTARVIFSTSNRTDGTSANRKGVGFTYSTNGDTPQDLAVYVGKADFGDVMNTATVTQIGEGSYVHAGCLVSDNGGSISFIWADGDYKETGKGATTWDGAYNSPSTTNVQAADQRWLALRDLGQWAPASGSEFVAMAIWNVDTIVKADFDTIYENMKLRGFG